MAIVFADKVKVRSYSTGTAEFTLETTVPGFQSFAAIGAGNECYYGIEDAAGNWEVGRGTYDTDSTQELLFRDTVISSSNSNNLVNFPAGGKSVFVTIPSSVAASIVASSASDSFKTITVAGQSNVVADSSTDTLTIAAGANIDITTNAGTDTITIANDLSAVASNILPSVDSDGTTGFTLGSPSFKWKELFVSNGSIYIGDVKLSNVGGKLVAVKVINPGEENEEEDPDDSDAASEIGGGGTGDSLTSNDDISITVNSEDSSSYIWNFGQTGALTFPDGTSQNTAYTGATGDANVWVQTFESNESGDIPVLANSVEYDAEGNVIALFVHSTDTAGDYYSVGKYTTAGVKIWTARFADNFYTDGWGLAVDNDSNSIYVAGKTAPENDGYSISTLTKIDGTDGSVVWSKSYDFGFNSQSAVVDVASDGNPVMVGYASSGEDDYITTTKADSEDGGIIWSRSLDGQGDEEAYGMAVGPSGEVVVIGYMDQLGEEGDTDDHMLVVKYNSSGAIQWQKAILFDAGFSSTGADADIDSDGNIYVTGNYQYDDNGTTTSALSILKLDSTGVKQWSRRVVGNCGTFGTSVVVGPDDKLYLSGVTGNNNNSDYTWVAAKYSFDGAVEWQRLIDNTTTWTFGGFFFFEAGSGSNIAVKQDYVVLGGGFGFLPTDAPYAAVVQVSANGDTFSAGDWDFKAATFSGTLNATASDITVTNAGKTDTDNIVNIDTATVSPMTDFSNFLIGTLYTVSSSGTGNITFDNVTMSSPDNDDLFIKAGDDLYLDAIGDDVHLRAEGQVRIKVGFDFEEDTEANQWIFESTGTLTLPDGGTITEGVVTDNPTIELKPATPDVASQKLVIKGGGGEFYNLENGIDLGTNKNVWAVSDSPNFYVYAPARANETLYWWIVPEGSGISTTMSGIVELGSEGEGVFNFTVISDAYEFRVRVSPTEDTYNSESIGVESVLMNGGEPTFGGDYHLHLTTGDLEETSIFLGTDDHNVRTTTDRKIQITTPNDVNNVWEFDATGNLTIPGNIRSEGNIDIEINLSDSTQRRWSFGEDGSLTFPDGTMQSTAGGAGFVELSDGTLQASAGVVDSTTLTDTLTNGRPDFLVITPRSPDRDTLDTHYGFDSTGMWFTGDNEDTFDDSPAYPIHTRDTIPADVKVVVEFDIIYQDGQEDWGVCVYPANGVPRWSWDPHPSRIAASIDIGDNDLVIYGFTDINSSSLNNPDPGTYTARFTYDPLAELTTFELLDADGAVTSRCELPGRLAKNQDYMIGFDADWDNPEPGERSYFSNLSITTSASAKATELTVSGEIKLPNTVRGFVNIQGPWANNTDDIAFQSVAAHDGFAYMGGESNWGNNNGRLDKYSLTTGELVWSRVLGAGYGAEFDISWTGGVYTLVNIANTGTGYQTGDVLYISGSVFSGDPFGDQFLNRATITVTDVSTTGNINSATIAGTAPEGDSSVSNATEYFSDAQGFPISVKYDTVNDNLVVLSYHPTISGDANDSQLDQATVIRINPVSGDVVSNVTLTDEGDIYPYDIAVHPTTGATAVVGEKNNEYKQFGTLTILTTGNGYFDILKTELDEEHWPGNQIPSDTVSSFLISGTGITGTESVNYVNFYEGLTNTTRQGTGATFNITDNGNGTYNSSIETGGTNYLVGHKIKILGSVLGGVDDTNDVTITVAAVQTGGIIDDITISGTAVGTEPDTYPALSGTNVDVGSGLTLDIVVDTLTGSRIVYVILGGSNYVANDVFVIPGTQFAGGTTPANDVEVTIVEIGEAGGNVTNAVTAGTTPTNAIRILVDGVDFTAVGGSWSMKQDLGGEAFVWTPNWNKAIGGGNTDRFQSVVYSKDGASIYAVGDGYYEVDYKQSLVVKFATSDGAIGFSKYLNSDTQDAYATGVATIGASDIVVSGYEYNTINGINRDHQFVARMTSAGQVVWKKFYGDGSWESNLEDNSDIQVDSDDNIYVTTQLGADNPSWNSSGFTVTKLDSTGNLLWTRCLSGNVTSDVGNTAGNRWSSLHNDQLIVAGYTYETVNDYSNGLWASFPTDGFTYFGGEDDFVQTGIFRFGQGRIKDGVRTFDTGGSFTPSVQPPNITAVTDLKNYATRTPVDSFPQHLHKMVDPKHGGLVFGDGTTQTTAGDRIPQIRGDNDYTITASDSGKHIYFRNNSGTVTIPGWWRVNLPVGFTFTIVNRTGNDCYVELEGWPGEIGTILGSGRNLNAYTWGIPDSGSGSMVTLIKLEDGHDYNNGGQQDGQVWMISGPDDLYLND